jgi:hypothetical protein
VLQSGQRRKTPAKKPGIAGGAEVNVKSSVNRGGGGRERRRGAVRLLSNASTIENTGKQAARARVVRAGARRRTAFYGHCPATQPPAAAPSKILRNFKPPAGIPGEFFFAGVYLSSLPNVETRTTLTTAENVSLGFNDNGNRTPMEMPSF